MAFDEVNPTGSRIERKGSPTDQTSGAVSKSNSKTSLLKQGSNHGSSCLQYFEIDHCITELVLSHRQHSKAYKLIDAPSSYSNDDCLYSLPSDVDYYTTHRMENAAWRRWSQKFFNLQRLKCDDGSAFPVELIRSQKTKRRVSFCERVDEMIIPPNPSAFWAEDYDFDSMEDRDDDPGFLDNFGSVCFNILITIGSMLTPYSNKKLESWLY